MNIKLIHGVLILFISFYNPFDQVDKMHDQVRRF